MVAKPSSLLEAPESGRSTEHARLPQEPPPRKKLRGLANAAGSFTVILCLLLSTTYLAMWAFYPWRPLAELDVPGWIVDFADQVDLMMTKRNPPIVILGSSLTLAAPRRLARPAVYQEEINARSGRKLDVCCMAVPGAIASDQDFILNELLEHKKKPDLIVYTYAPRDFMDNTIEGKINTTPTRKVLTFINRRSSFLPKDLSWAALSQCFDNHAAFIDMVHRHVLRLARNYVCKISGHPESLWEASKHATAPAGADGKASVQESKQEGDSNSGKNADETPAFRQKALAADLELYNRRYNPQNKARIDEQYSHLEQLLSVSRAKNIRVELVGMPVSPANMALLQPGVFSAMQKRLQTLATKYGAGLYDFNTDGQVSFAQDEYLDSVHLSTGGAAHFVPLFANHVVASDNFQHVFGTTKK
ncbi:MAG: DUF1574 family protein [Cyanobacteria bacterium SZAS LIN-3]|nr:DUF1574 family protein [Cyanobacteria bacterium SZAS LIN-3]